MGKISDMAQHVRIIWDSIPKSEKDAIKYWGPRGGRNARHIKGWVHTGDQTLTKACHAAGVITMPWYSGSAPTPARAIPECLYRRLLIDV
jgi:hypothetical protein